ncbi:hypothetical protein D9M71_499180 [compost metagenome]
MGEALEAGGALDLRVEAPDLLAGVRVQRQHLAVGGAGVEHAVDLERGILVGQFDRVVSGWQVARAYAPGFLQLADIGGGNLSERRIAITELGAAIGLPFAVRHFRCRTLGARVVAAQFALDFTGVGELAGHGCRAGRQHPQGQ